MVDGTPRRVVGGRARAPSGRTRRRHDVRRRRRARRPSSTPTRPASSRSRGSRSSAPDPVPRGPCAGVPTEGAGRRLPWKGDPRHRHLARHRRRGRRARRRRALRRSESRDPRGHAEVIGSLLEQALAEASVAPSDITHVAAGMGPGPFTGLRVGIAAARAFALGRGIPVVPVVSHDAVALELLLHARYGRRIVGTSKTRDRDVRRRHRRPPARVRLHASTAGSTTTACRSGWPSPRSSRATTSTASSRAAECGTPRRRPHPRRDARARRRRVRSPPGRTIGPADALYLRSPDVTLSAATEAGGRMTARHAGPDDLDADHGARAGVVPDRRLVGRR